MHAIQLSNKHFPWHEAAFTALTTREAALPHALLLQGRAGIGKTAFARSFAQWLLCEGTRTPAAACGECEACRWFEQGNHPDYRQVEPDALNEAAESERSKEASKQIRIEQVRELQGFLAVGTHRAGRRIAVLRPAEAMNPATANAVLKSLEEPPPHTLFLLVSSQPARLLPTIRSRCQSVPLPTPGAEAGTAWLRAQGAAAAGAEALLAHASYAPLAALDAAAQVETRDRLLTALAQGEDDPLRLADACAGAEPAQVIDWLHKWIYDLAAIRLQGRARYHPQAAERLGPVAHRLVLPRLLRFERELSQARAIATHPLNPRLFLEALFMDYQALREA